MAIVHIGLPEYIGFKETLEKEPNSQ